MHVPITDLRIIIIITDSLQGKMSKLCTELNSSIVFKLYTYIEERSSNRCRADAVSKMSGVCVLLLLLTKHNRFFDDRVNKNGFLKVAAKFLRFDRE